MDLRLPRVLGAMVVGAGLACAGTVFQAILRNPMADPYIIGTAAGASLGATLRHRPAARSCPRWPSAPASAWLGLGLVQLLAFVGGLGTVLLVIAIARQGGRLPSVTLLLTGYAVSSLLAAGVALLMFASGRALAAIFSWLMGSLAGGRLDRPRRRGADRGRRLRPPLRPLAKPEPASARRRAGRPPRHRRRAREAAPHASWPRSPPRLSSRSPGPSASSASSSRTCCGWRSGPTIGSCCRPAPCSARRSSWLPTSARAWPAGSRSGSSPPSSAHPSSCGCCAASRRVAGSLVGMTPGRRGRRPPRVVRRR